MRGASFFGEIAAAAGLLHTQLEEALAELVAWGLVTADSFTGLRALLVPTSARRSRCEEAGSRPRERRHGERRPLVAPAPASGAGDETAARATPSRRPPGRSCAATAWSSAKLLDRETARRPGASCYGLPAAGGARRDPRRPLRGRLLGEQYALTEAVGQLRALRSSPARETWSP